MMRRAVCLSCLSVAILLAVAGCASVRISGESARPVDVDALPMLEPAPPTAEPPAVAVQTATRTVERPVEEVLSSIPAGRVSGGPLSLLKPALPPSRMRKPPLLVREAPPERPKPPLVIPSLGARTR